MIITFISILILKILELLRMRRRISLYINDRKVDLDSQSFILMNYTAEDLSNPTIVKNSFSQTITLKRTPKNDIVFGCFFRPDKEINAAAFNNFNPLMRSPFVIYGETGEILESGYVKLNRVGKDGYEISLFGGLGEFFYNLTYKEDGTKQNLGDMTFQALRGYTYSADDYVTLSPLAITDAWNYLRTGSEILGNSVWYNIINFAPCYNGFVDKFDHKHAVIDGSTFGNFPMMRTEDSESYTIEDDTIITFTNNHNEYEVANLISILQRPVISVKSIFAAICNPDNNGGYSVTLDPNFFNSGNDWFEKGWITLDLAASKIIENANANIKLGDLLAGTDSPADYIIGYAKMFGLVFEVDKDTKSVSILDRGTYYQSGKYLDMASRIEEGSEEFTPFLLQSKYYRMTPKDVKGEFVEQYQKDYGKVYGEQIIDTNYDFESKPIELLDNIVYRGAADVQGASLNYRTLLTSANKRFLSVALTENVKVRMTKVAGTDTKDFDSKTITDGSVLEYPYLYNNLDFMPRPQFCDGEGKDTGGANVLLFINAFVNIPQCGATGIYHDFYLTDGLSVKGLNDGVPCYDLRRTGTALTWLPSFRRMRIVSGNVNKAFDFGVPNVVSDVNFIYANPNAFLYNARWKNYLRDRYDKDSRVMTAKVNLQGLQVDEKLLRNFWHYKNCVWVLNRIINHSVTTFDLTDCEFVKVKDRENYTGIAVSDDYLSADSSAITMEHSAGSILLNIFSNVDWEIDNDLDWLTISPNSGEGDGVITIAYSANTGDTKRTGSFTLSSPEHPEVPSFIVHVAQNAAPAVEDYLSTDKASINVGHTAASTTLQVSSNVSWTAATAQGWITISPMSGTGDKTLAITIAANMGESRTGLIYLSCPTNPELSASVMVNQSAGNYIALDPDSLVFDHVADSQSVIVSSNQTWEVVLTDDWVSVSPMSGSGDGVLNVSVPAYSGQTDRETTIIVQTSDGQIAASANVLQTGQAVTHELSCDISAITSPKAGKTMQMHITGNVGWTITKNQSWVSVSPVSGTGDATINVTIAENTGLARRVASIVITPDVGDLSPITIDVQQESGHYLRVDPDSVSINAAGSEYPRVQLQANVAWTAVREDNWLMVAPATGNTDAEVAIGAQPNTTGDTRFGTITFTADDEPSLTAAVMVIQEG